VGLFAILRRLLCLLANRPTSLHATQSNRNNPNPPNSTTQPEHAHQKTKPQTSLSGGPPEPLPNAANAALLALLYANQRGGQRPILADTKKKLECFALSQVRVLVLVLVLVMVLVLVLVLVLVMVLVFFGDGAVMTAVGVVPPSQPPPTDTHQHQLMTSTEPQPPQQPPQKLKATYILGGQVGRNRGFVAGLGPRAPLSPQHRQASCPPFTKGRSSPPRCTAENALFSEAPNPSTLYGALVAGPDSKDEYDDRRVAPGARVGLHFNAGLMGALAGLIDRDVMPGQCQVRRGVGSRRGVGGGVAVGAFLECKTQVLKAGCALVLQPLKQTLDRYRRSNPPGRQGLPSRAAARRRFRGGVRMI
jgi:hypothetical protein